MSDAKKMLKELAYTHLVPKDEQGRELVAVVRCKDCKYREGDFGNGAFCNHIASGLFGDIFADDYCSYGERKDDVH